MTTPDALGQVRTLASGAADLFPVRVLRKFIEHGGPNQATLIAWNALTAVFPIGLALAAIGGFVLYHAGVTGQVLAETMASFFPTDLGTREAIVDGLDSLQHQTGLLAVLALLGFLWTGSNLFGAMEGVFGVIFETSPRHFLRQKLMDVSMMSVFAILALFAVGTSAILPLLGQIRGFPVSLTDGNGSLVQIVVGFLSSFVLFFVIYLVVPNRRQRLGAVLPAALFGGVAFELLTRLWPIYIQFNRQGLNRFGSQFALLFILLAFFYILGVINVLGADIIAVLDPPREQEQAREATALPKPMGRVRRAALGAAALLIGVAAGRRQRA